MVIRPKSCIVTGADWPKGHGLWLLSHLQLLKGYSNIRSSQHIPRIYTKCLIGWDLTSIKERDLTSPMVPFNMPEPGKVWVSQQHSPLSFHGFYIIVQFVNPTQVYHSCNGW